MAFNFNFPIVLGGPNSAGGITVGKIPSDVATTSTTTTTTTTTAAPLAAGLYAFGDATPSNGIYQDITSPASKVTQIDSSATWTSFDQSSGYNATNTLVIRKNDTELWGWGYNSYGQLAQNNTIHRSSPVQIAGTWSKVAGTAGIKSDGTLWMWGPSYGGVLGNNVGYSNDWKSSPIQTVAGGNTWTNMVTAGGATIAVKSDFSMWSWGLNYSGRLGHYNQTNRSSPVQITYPTSFQWGTKIAMTGTYGAAINKFNLLYMWGDNTYGQLGSSDTMSRSRPNQVGVTDQYSHVAIGDNCTYAVKTDGTLWTWGKNTNGYRLGIEENWYTPNNSNIVDPAQVNGGGTYIKAAINADYARVFLKSDGTLWGLGYLKHLGIGEPANSTAKVSSPIQIGGGNSGWVDIIAYNDKFFAIKSS